MTPTKKQQLLALSVFFAGLLAGLLISGGIGGYFIWRIVNVLHLQQDLSAASEAQTVLLYMKRVDWGTTNAIAKLQDDSRERLSEYIHDVEQSKKEGRKLDEMTLETYQAARAYLFPFTFGEKREEDFFWKKMLPSAQEFVERNKLPAADFGTNNIGKYRIEFFQDGRAGCTANLKLKSGLIFTFLSDGTNVEVSAFSDGRTKTYYELDSAPKEEMDAVKALNLRNKLNDAIALELAKSFFVLLGHKEENFHPAELHQSYWVGQNDVWGNLPYYEVTWYRTDVTKEKRESGDSKELLKSVTIEVSGIDSHLISYSKGLLPIGSDF